MTTRRIVVGRRRIGKKLKKRGGDDDKKVGDESNCDGEDKKGEGKKSEVPIHRYVIGHAHPSQYFMDENPNTCSIM
jgi:hypothetical protein